MALRAFSLDFFSDRQVDPAKVVRQFGFDPNSALYQKWINTFGTRPAQSPDFYKDAWIVLVVKNGAEIGLTAGDLTEIFKDPNNLFQGADNVVKTKSEDKKNVLFFWLYTLVYWVDAKKRVDVSNAYYTPDPAFSLHAVLEPLMTDPSFVSARPSRMVTKADIRHRYEMMHEKDWLSRPRSSAALR